MELDHFRGIGKKTDPGTSIEHSLKSGAEASEILAGIACTNTALRLATRQLTNLYDEALEPTELKATQAALLAQIEKLTADHGPALQDLAEGLAMRRLADEVASDKFLTDYKIAGRLAALADDDEPPSSFQA